VAKKAGAIRAGRAFVEIFADSSMLVRGLRGASAKLKAFGVQVVAIGAGIRSAGLRMFAAGAMLAAPLVMATKTFTGMGDDLAKMSKRTGLSVEALSELGYAARRSGASMEDVEKSVRLMQRRIVEAATGSKEGADALELLGLTVADLAALRPEDQFALVADHLAAIENPTQRAAAAMEIFGRSGTKLLPMVKDLGALRAEAGKKGFVISTEDARMAEEFQDTLEDLWTTIKMGVFAVGAALAPTLKDLAERIREVVGRVTRWIRANRGFIVSALKFAVILGGAGAGLIILGTIITIVGKAIIGLGIAFAAAAVALKIIGAILGFILSPIGLVVAAVVGLGVYLLWSTGAGGKALAWLGEKFGELKDFALESLKGIGDALAAGDIALAAKVLWASLKLAWQKGTHGLEMIWIDFKHSFLVTMTEIGYGFMAIWEKIKAKVATVAAEMKAMLVTAWSVGKGLVALKLHEWEYRREATILKARRDLEPWAMKEYGGGLSEEAFKREWAILAEKTKAKRLAIEGETAGAIVGSAEELKAELLKIAADEKTALEEIGGKISAAKAKLAQAHGAEVLSAETELADAEMEWMNKQREAAEARFAAGLAPEAVGPPEAPPFPGLEILLDGLEKAGRDLKARGTFSAFQAEQLGFGDALTDAAKATAKNTKRLVDMAEEGGLVFD